MRLIDQLKEQIDCTRPLEGGVVGLWSVHWTPNQAVRVRALVGITVLCSWVQNLSLTVLLELHPRA